jgi:O-antigen/teichoic acid export membrane protein
MIRPAPAGLRQRLQSWGRDRLLKRVLRNSSYLFASYAIGAILTIVTARLLGAEDFGVLGVVTVFVANVNRLFSFRMGDVVVKYMGESLALGNQQRAAAVVKIAFLAEALTSLVAFLALILLAPLGATYFARDAQAVPYFIIFGISILVNLINESSVGVLQVTNHYRSQALINLVQTVLVAVLLGLAAVFHAGLMVVLGIYLLGKIILGAGPACMAIYWLPRVLGKDWLRASFNELPSRREMFRFAVNTNFNGTVTMIARDNELPVVSFFFGTAAAGYYKIALALINLIVQPINPFISTTYPEITRTFTNREWTSLRTLLRRMTIISAVWTGSVTLGLILFGQRLLFQPWVIMGRTFELLSEYAPAYPLVLILLVGFGAANIFFWNRPLLLAQGQAGYPFRVSLWAMLVKVALTLLWLPHADVWAAAALLAAYLLVTVLLIVWRGLRGVDQARAAALEQTPA